MAWLRRVDSALDSEIRQSLFRQSSKDNQFSHPLAANELMALASILKGQQELNSLPTDLKPDLEGLVDSLGLLAKAQNDSELDSALGAIDKPIQKLKTQCEKTSFGEHASSSHEAEELRTLGCNLADRIANRKQHSPLISKEALEAAQHLLLREIASEEENIGYTVVESGGAKKDLIIGVVGKETMQEVSSRHQFRTRLDLAAVRSSVQSQRWRIDTEVFQTTLTTATSNIPPFISLQHWSCSP